MDPRLMNSDRLKNMLNGAKAVMNKVESGDYQTGNVTLDTSISGEQLVESAGGNNMPMQNVNNVAPKIVNNVPIYKNIENSKLPANIKKAMMEKPIPQLSGPNHTFNLEDVQELVQPVRQQQPQQRKPQVTESFQKNANDTFTVSESTLIRIVEDIVDKRLNAFMTETYNRNLTEQAIKKTINTLIKEGKIKPKKNV